MNQLQSEITQLESNPAKNQAELESKRKKLKELQEKEKQLFKSLPITTQISNLKREIKQLENKSTRTKAEEVLLSEKKKALAELLKKQQGANTDNAKPTDKTALYIGLAIGAVVLIVYPANADKLTYLDIRDNNLPEQDLAVFSIYNRFAGSLETLKNLTKLQELDIKNTDINSGKDLSGQQLKSCTDFGLQPHDYGFACYLTKRGYTPQSEINLEELRKEYYAKSQKSQA
ncbi:10836_t:CDS:2 [Ambispora leptoticha]|uniref:10836_t:CDS:1 n=1 Tax=Ambispora leptoticha TaxID=144679 RepID=A0A9N9BRB2_9GLOM|nr:10836_t:CDS:2 [Ambispora leptoticha]